MYSPQTRTADDGLGDREGQGVSDQTDAVTVTYTANGGVDKLVVENSTANRTLSTVGESVTDVPFHNPVSVITRVRFGTDYDGGNPEVVLWDDVLLTKTE